MKNDHKGILILPIILLFYFIVGTLEFNLEQRLTSIEVNTNEVEYSPQIENIKALHNEIEDKLHEMEEDMEDLMPDENLPLSGELQIHLKNECDKYGVNINEAIAIMLTENPTADFTAVNENKNGTVDVGIFQINSCRNDELREIGITNLKDPKQNITAGVFIISTLDKYDGHEKYMAYNMGESGMRKAVSRGFDSTAYSRKVMGKLNR